MIQKHVGFVTKAGPTFGGSYVFLVVFERLRGKNLQGNYFKHKQGSHHGYLRTFRTTQSYYH